MKALAVIPARYGARRLPGKPLCLLGGRPVVQWVYEAASAYPEFAEVVVATDSEEIARCVRSFGGAAEMTRSDHETGSDRAAEVAERHPEMDVIANVQGDQPFVTPRMLSDLLSPYLRGEQPEMTTLACPLDEEVGAVDDPNVVKVVCDLQDRALYFSRAPIPWAVGPTRPEYLHHLGLYAFRADVLRRYARLTAGELEAAERLEQLRALEHGFSITVCRTERAVLEINTPDDLERANALVSKAATR